MLSAFTDILQEFAIWGLILLIIVIIYHGLTLQKIYWPERFYPKRLQCKTNRDLTLDSVVSFHPFIDLWEKKDTHIRTSSVWKRPPDFADRFSSLFMHIYTDKLIYKCVVHRYILKGLPLSMKKGNLIKMCFHWWH